MAYSQEQWDRAEALFKLGYSLGDIEKDTGISKGQISKKSKKENWKKETHQVNLKADIVEFDEKKETLDREKETITKRLATLNDFQVTILQEKLEQEGASLAKSLVFNTATLALIRNNEMLTKNKKTVMMKTGEFMDGKKVGETYEPFETTLSPSDTKDIIDSTDKASITLGVNERHAPKTEISNTNAQQTNVSVEDISKAIADGLPD